MQYNIHVAEMVAIYRRREQHEKDMATLVVSASIISMEAALENSGCLAVTRSWN